jgi:hypothetical protein
MYSVLRSGALSSLAFDLQLRMDESPQGVHAALCSANIPIVSVPLQ